MVLAASYDRSMVDRDENDPQGASGHGTSGQGASEKGTTERSDEVGDWLQPLFDEPTLWPLLSTGVLIAATLGAAALFLALEDGNLAAMAGIAALAGLTLYGLDSDIKQRRLGPSARVVTAIWVLAVAGGLTASALI